jgi:hypothetical protein
MAFIFPIPLNFFWRSCILREKRTDMSKLPDLHRQALALKNKKRLQRDGGRAWIKDSQLHEARKDANGRLITIHEKLGLLEKENQSAKE